MQFIVKVFIMAIATISLGGCATYVEPSSSQGVATIQGSSHRESLMSWDVTDITFIDDKSLGYRWSESSKFNILPGEHEITVNAAFNRGLCCGGPYYAIIQIPFVAKPNTHYMVNSSPRGTEIRSWVEDTKNCQRVSIIKSKPYQIAPKESAPIIITK